MEKLFVYVRRRDGKRVEFFSEMRAGRLTYLIREANRQDSVTRDREGVDLFRQNLANDGYTLVPLDSEPQ